MGVVSGFRHDLFVSYAHADDEPVAGAEQGFVSQLVSDLRKEAGRKVGSALDMWWDHHKLAGDSPVTPEIVQAAADAAAIVMVVSLAYLRSEWCRRERSTFLAALDARGGGGGVFIVAIEDLDRSRLPPEFQDLIPHNFWKKLSDDQTSRPLRVDFPSDRELYYDRLSQLVQKVADHLNRLLQQAPQPAPQPAIVVPGVAPGPLLRAAPGFPGAERPAPAGGVVRATDDGDEAATLVLAEVTDDLVQQREEVKAYLEQLGYDVLPKKRYSRDDLDLHCRQLRDDLEQSRLFVQLLGPLAGDRSDYPKGMAWLRYASALPLLPTARIVQWRDPQLDVGQVADSDARELLSLPTVRSCGLQEFKQAVAALMQRKPRERAAPAPKCLFVNADLLDRGFATEISNWLTGQGYIVLEPPMTTDPAAWREEWETNLSLCQGLMLVFGKTRPCWVTQQFLQSSKVIAQREVPIELLSICVGPPPPSQPGHDKLEELSLHYAPMKYFRCDGGLNPAELARIGEFLGDGHGDGV